MRMIWVMKMTMMMTSGLIINNEHSFMLQPLHKARVLTLVRWKSRQHFSITSARTWCSNNASWRNSLPMVAVRKTSSTWKTLISFNTFSSCRISRRISLWKRCRGGRSQVVWWDPCLHKTTLWDTQIKECLARVSQCSRVIFLACQRMLISLLWTFWTKSWCSKPC